MGICQSICTTVCENCTVLRLSHICHMTITCYCLAIYMYININCYLTVALYGYVALKVLSHDHHMISHDHHMLPPKGGSTSLSQA